MSFSLPRKEEVKQTKMKRAEREEKIALLQEEHKRMRLRIDYLEEQV